QCSRTELLPMRSLATLLLLAACTAATPTESALSPMTLEEGAPLPTGRILVSISDPAADEGLFWNFAVSSDGRVVGENTWSDGADSFRSNCAGQRDAHEVGSRFESVRASATLARAPVPTRPPDFERLEVRISFENSDGPTLYMPAGALDDETRAWAESLVGDCR
ncbi:MAG: hypothetical protein KUG77_13565, partial [Nannocystaceae bacterium]|nr:hypothetical protein [Nannocystaceae bacterium]